jgi:hypothetical protein
MAALATSLFGPSDLNQFFWFRVRYSLIGKGTGLNAEA